MNEEGNEQILTPVFWKIAKAWADPAVKNIWIEGGTWASKTFSVMQLIVAVCNKVKRPLLLSTVSETVPHLKRGTIRDFINIMGDAYSPTRFNRTDLIYNFGKIKLEFFSADDPSKQRGARRDVLYINEANNVPYDAYRELHTRTRLKTICDWNPVSEFWFHEHKLANDPGSAYIHATYRDAIEVIPPSVLEKILEMGKKDPNWANVYLEGKLGKIEGLVYPSFEQVDELPDGFTVYGLDFGFSNDPSVLTKNVLRGDELYSHEVFYQAGLTNDVIARMMIEAGVKPGIDLIMADEAEPKSIEEIRRYGFNIRGCPKGQGSVEFGHQKLRQFKQHWTKSSLNCIKEQRNYRYIQDKDGRLTEKTTHAFSHGMDSRRYAVVGVTVPQPEEKIVYYDAMGLIEDV